ncbi:hypothetical protein MED15_06178 [Micromonospora noduli]|uniref:Uncharacterized protein n=1 Tax=Micromonospora noduli TaxID=709876 RepID=A0ABX9CU53_9ACTN|nr:hypothetical protein MED15_06178 [Micromonospora noduli]
MDNVVELDGVRDEPHREHTLQRAPRLAPMSMCC